MLRGSCPHLGVRFHDFAAWWPFFCYPRCSLACALQKFKITTILRVASIHEFYSPPRRKSGQLRVAGIHPHGVSCKKRSPVLFTGGLSTKKVSDLLRLILLLYQSTPGVDFLNLQSPSLQQMFPITKKRPESATARKTAACNYKNQFQPHLNSDVTIPGNPPRNFVTDYLLNAAEFHGSTLRIPPKHTTVTTKNTLRRFAETWDHWNTLQKQAEGDSLQGPAETRWGYHPVTLRVLSKYSPGSLPP